MIVKSITMRQWYDIKVSMFLEAMLNTCKIRRFRKKSRFGFRRKS